MHFDVDAWADAYIRARMTSGDCDQSHPDYWAIEKFMYELDGELAEQCWQGIVAVVGRRPEVVLGMLAATLMEDLLDHDGQTFIRRIETEARRSPLFRRMLRGGWESGPPDVWERLVAFREN